MVTMATPKTRKRKPKRQIVCNCPTCTPDPTFTGVRYCFHTREHGIYHNGEGMGWRSSLTDAEIVLRRYRYNQLTKTA